MTSKDVKRLVAKVDLPDFLVQQLHLTNSDTVLLTGALWVVQFGKSGLEAWRGIQTDGLTES